MIAKNKFLVGKLPLLGGIFYLLFIAVGCSCHNQPVNRDTPTTTPPNDPPPPPLPKPLVSDNQVLDNAIKKLEQAKDSNPQLARVYDVIKTLLPNQFQVMDGKRSQVNPEKNGKELFDKILTRLPDSMDGVVEWLITEGVLDVNNDYSTGKTALATVLDDIIKRRADGTALEDSIKSLTSVGLLLKKKGSTLSAGEASQLLMEYMDAGIKTVWKIKLSDQEKEMMDWLQTQGATISPDQGAALLLQLVDAIKAAIYFPFPGTDKDYILAKVQQAIGTAVPVVQSDKLNGAMAKAAEEKMGSAIYDLLLQLGANPNAIVGLEQLPLLDYSNRNSDTELFDCLLKSPAVNVNAVVDEYNNNLMMNIAYHYPSPPLALSKLLENPNADINTIKSNGVNINDYTLLDILVNNCIGLLISADVQENRAWLELLKTLVAHPNFFVTNENITKAQAAYWRGLGLGSSTIDPDYSKKKAIAQEALAILTAHKK